MQLTRQQILDYLNENRMATPIDLSRALQVTAANIRHHLHILETSGFVEVVGQQPGRGRGRPMQIYSLTENARRHNLEGLSSALLQTLLVKGSDNADPLAQVAAALRGTFEPAGNIHARLNQSIEKLNQLQYQASWEASPGGPRIILRNCPYALILHEYPQLCQMDASLISGMLQQPFEQTVKLERHPDGAPHCAFIGR